MLLLCSLFLASISYLGKHWFVNGWLFKFKMKILCKETHMGKCIFVSVYFLNILKLLKYIEFHNNEETKSRLRCMTTMTLSQCQSIEQHFQYVSPWSVSTEMLIYHILLYCLVSKTPAVLSCWYAMNIAVVFCVCFCFTCWSVYFLNLTMWVYYKLPF